MVDTQRSQSQLLTALFQDGQAANSITAQDVRDLIVSYAPSFGAMIITSAAATQTVSTGTYLKASGTTTGLTLNNFTSTGNNRLKYTGNVASHVYINANLSVSAVNANQTLGFRIAKNGTADANSEVTRRIQGVNDVASISIGFGVSVSSSDFVELFVTNQTSTGALTVDSMYFHIQGNIE